MYHFKANNLTFVYVSDVFCDILLGLYCVPEVTCPVTFYNKLVYIHRSLRCAFQLPET